MRAIRAWHGSETYYSKVFQSVSGMSAKDYHVLKKGFDLPKSENFDATDRLTALREKLSASGYKEAVKKADARFLAEHRGYTSEEAWEKFWADFCARHNIDLRTDAI